MRRRDYDRFTAELAERAEDDDRITGLVVLGSTAGERRQPDEWSDHDFFVIAEPGRAAELRADRTWLPDHERIVVHFRETEHGRSAVYDDGHLAEFAVFEPGEVRTAKINARRVLVGDDDLVAELDEVAEASDVRDVAAEDRFGMFVVQVAVGVGRFARGEELSANALVRGWAVLSLLALVAELVPPTEDVGDLLDPHRRAERTHPAIAARISAALPRPVPELAGVLVDIAEQELEPRSSAVSLEAIAALRGIIDRAP